MPKQPLAKLKIELLLRNYVKWHEKDRDNLITEIKRLDEEIVN